MTCTMASIDGVSLNPSTSSKIVLTSGIIDSNVPYTVNGQAKRLNIAQYTLGDCNSLYDLVKLKKDQAMYSIIE